MPLLSRSPIPASGLMSDRADVRFAKRASMAARIWSASTMPAAVTANGNVLRRPEFAPPVSRRLITTHTILLIVEAHAGFRQMRASPAGNPEWRTLIQPATDASNRRVYFSSVRISCLMCAGATGPHFSSCANWFAIQLSTCSFFYHFIN